MRKFLLATALFGVLSGPVRAQVIVNDPASLIQQVKAFVQENKKYLLQLQELEREAQTAISTGQMVAGMIQHPNLGAAMGLMNMAGLGSVLPVSPYAVQGLIAGHNNIRGIPSQLSGLINGSFGGNTVYTCHGRVLGLPAVTDEFARPERQPGHRDERAADGGKPRSDPQRTARQPCRSHHPGRARKRHGRASDRAGLGAAAKCPTHLGSPAHAVAAGLARPARQRGDVTRDR